MSKMPCACSCAHSTYTYVYTKRLVYSSYLCAKFNFPCYAYLYCTRTALVVAQVQIWIAYLDLRIHVPSQSYVYSTRTRACTTLYSTTLYFRKYRFIVLLSKISCLQFLCKMELKALHTRVPVCRRVHVRVRIFVHSLAIILLLFYVQYPIRVQLYLRTCIHVRKQRGTFKSTKVRKYNVILTLTALLQYGSALVLYTHFQMSCRPAINLGIVLNLGLHLHNVVHVQQGPVNNMRKYFREYVYVHCTRVQERSKVRTKVRRYFRYLRTSTLHVQDKLI